MVYILIGVLWILVCCLIGLYITGTGFSEKSHFRIGIKTIFISYLLGLCLLFTMIIKGS